MDKILIGRASELGLPERSLIERKILELAPAYTGSPVFSWVLEGNKLYITVTQA
jgi:hypothetical protein